MFIFVDSLDSAILYFNIIANFCGVST